MLLRPTAEDVMTPRIVKYTIAVYAAALFWRPGDGADPLPATIRTQVAALLAERDSAAEADIDAIDRKLVDATYYYVLRPDEIARRVIASQHLPPRVLTVAQATLVLAALGESGYPITGNGAPDYCDECEEHGCDGGECQRPDAYGCDEREEA